MRYGKAEFGTARIVAFVAALALLLQATLAVAVPPVQRDLFGNVICADGSGGQKPGEGGQRRTHLPDCCTLSCGGSPASADLPASVEWRTMSLAKEAIAYPPARIVFLNEQRSPANPRAPPTAA
jgi:hypothetical protein